MAPQQPIRPYQQGQLDGLCAIYSTINSIRLVLGADGKHLHRQAWGELFYELMAVADDAVGAVAATACGIDTKPLRKILKTAVRHMADEHEIEIVVATFLPRSERPTFDQLATRMSDLLRQPGCALIASFEDLDHWTVVRGISDRWLELFDSIGLSRLSVAHCRMSYEAPRRDGLEHVLHRRAMFQVRRTHAKSLNGFKFGFQPVTPEAGRQP